MPQGPHKGVAGAAIQLIERLAGIRELTRIREHWSGCWQRGASLAVVSDCEWSSVSASSSTQSAVAQRFGSYPQQRRPLHMKIAARSVYDLVDSQWSGPVITRAARQ